MGMIYEFTARGTPQQNGKLERKLRTLWSRTRAMMNGANLQGEMRGNLWAETVRTSTMIDTVLTPSNEKSSYEKFHKMKPTFMNKPRIFGEIGILKKNKKIFSKLENKGTSCMFVGYSEDHPADTYRLYILDTRKVVIARDVQWLDTTINQNRRMMIDNRGIDTSKWIEEEIDLDDAKVDEKKVRFTTSQDLTTENNEREKRISETDRTIYVNNEEDNRNTVENENEVETNSRREIENQDKTQEEN